MKEEKSMPERKTRENLQIKHVRRKNISMTETTMNTVYVRTVPHPTPEQEVTQCLRHSTDLTSRKEQSVGRRWTVLQLPQWYTAPQSSSSLGCRVFGN